MRVEDDGRDEAGGRRHGNGDVHVLVLSAKGENLIKCFFSEEHRGFNCYTPSCSVCKKQGKGVIIPRFEFWKMSARHTVVSTASHVKSEMGEHNHSSAVLQKQNIISQTRHISVSRAVYNQMCEGTTILRQ